MFNFFVADGITTMFFMADVIAIMADGIAIFFVADGITTLF